MLRINFNPLNHIILCLLFLTGPVAGSLIEGSNGFPQVLKVGLIDGGREPYYWQDQKTERLEGFYIDIMKVVAAETGVKFDYHFAPQARIRLYMRLGLYNFEPGIAKSWRQEPEEVEHSVYTVPFLVLQEVIVSRSQLRGHPKSLQDVGPGRVCQVLGFSGKDNAGREEVVVINDLQALRMLDRGRCEYAVMPLDVARYLSKQHGFQLYFSQPLNQHFLSLRLDKQFEHLLPGMNRALEKLWESGKMAALLDHYQIQSLMTHKLDGVNLALLTRGKHRFRPLCIGE